MSYQSINVGVIERFFTVINRRNGNPITSGDVNYYLKSRSGVYDGKYWDDSNRVWVDSETANPMIHDVDGHWSIELSQSPFVDNVRYLEYIKADSDLHIPDCRHLIAQYMLSIDISGEVVAGNVNNESIINAIIVALRDVEIRPTRTVIGSCQQSTSGQNLYTPQEKQVSSFTPPL